MPVEVEYSAGEDAKQMAEQLKPLLAENGGRWTLTEDGKGLERDVKFKTFKTTWEYMNVVAEQCKVTRHHPEWSNVYNKTHIRWTTHNPVGLSHKDIEMARFCDEQATRLAEMIEAPGSETKCCT